MKAYYEVLGVNSKASAEQIQQAYAARCQHISPRQDPVNYRNLREAFELLSHPTSRALLDGGLSLPNEVRRLAEEAIHAAQQDRTEEALQKAEQALRLAPESQALGLLYGQICLRCHRLDEAQARFDSLISGPAPAPIALIYAARTLMEKAGIHPDQQILDEAYRLYQRAEELDPKNGDVPLGMARIHLLRREDSAALRCLEQSVRADGQLDYQDLESLQLGARIRMRLRNWPAFDDTCRRLERASQGPVQRAYAAELLLHLAQDAAVEGSGLLSALRAGFLARQISPSDDKISLAVTQLEQGCPAELLEKVRREQSGSVTVRMQTSVSQATPEPGPSAPDPSAKSVRISPFVGPLVVLVSLLLFIGLGAAGRYWLTRPRLFCGQPTPPQGPDSSACRESLKAYGRALQERQKQAGFFPRSSEVQDLPGCPLSDVTYGYISSHDQKQAWLQCVGRVHGTPNTPAFDFSNGEVVDQPIIPPKKSVAHFQWLLWSQEKSAYEEALQEAKGLTGEVAVDGLNESLALRLLQRYQEALDVLASTQDEKPPAAIECLLGLGRYEEALALARVHQSSVARIFYLKGDFTNTLAETARSKASVPEPLIMWVSLCKADYAQNFDDALAYLEATGCTSNDSQFAILMLVISSQALADSNKLETARKFLKRGLEEAPRCWPFPLLRLANGETTEKQLEAERTPGELSELRAIAGLLLEAKGKKPEAMEHFQWVANQPDKRAWELRLALSRLGQ